MGEAVRLKVGCRAPARRRPLDVALFVRVPSLCRLLVRLMTGLPHGRLRRALLRYGKCRLNDAFNRRDLATIPAMFHPRGEAHAATPQGLPLGFDLDPVSHGPEAFQKALERWLAAWAVFHADLREIIDLGEQAERPSARERYADRSTMYHVWHVPGGKARAAWGYSTREEALEAVGLRE